MQERQGQVPPGSEFRGQWLQLEDRGGLAVLNVLSLVLLRGEVTHFLFAVTTLSDFQLLPEFAGKAGGLEEMPGPLQVAARPPGRLTHTLPGPCRLTSGAAQRAVSCVFFLMWKIIGQQDSLALELFFSNLCEKLYFNLKELIKDDCHPKCGFIHCSVLAPRAGLGTP